VNLYHIATRGAWSAAKQRDVYEPPSLEKEGFVHCSTAAQLLHVARRFYSGKTDLVLLVMDPARLRPTLKWERVLDKREAASPDEDSAYPHIYGPVNLDAVTEVLDFEPGPDGEFRLPFIAGREAGTKPE
jgi:uncharacterized protein (DUF952 family)